jgi:hypothetical protein
MRRAPGSRGKGSAPTLDRVFASKRATLTHAARSAGHALFFGLRLWAAACLALYIAFSLELDSAYWAGTSAVVVSLPTVGASLRKAKFRMAGTVVGAVAIVVLTACFPQDRAAFIVGLALWGAACGFAGSILQNFASYGAALAAVTAAIIALDELGATGGPNGDAFTFAVTRATEIWIGIVCASVLASGTDFGSARGRLSEQIAAIASEIVARLVSTFSKGGSEAMRTRAVRRDLTRRVIDLGPLIEEAIGESSDLRYRGHMVKNAVDGLYAALAGWRVAAIDLEVRSSEEASQEARIIFDALPMELRFSAKSEDVSMSIITAPHARRTIRASARAMVALRGGSPSLQLLSGSTAEALLGICRALDGLILLADPARIMPQCGPDKWLVPDLLPAVVNAVRVFLTVIAVALFWIVTGWPNGATALTFALVTVTVLSSRGDQAYAGALTVLLGGSVTAALAATVKFAVLPGTDTFFGFCVAIGLVLVPVGALEVWDTQIFLPVAAYFIPNLAPTNPANYDLAQFYNAALAILAGLGAGALAFRLLPPPSPALRARRLLALTLRDLRRLVTGQLRSTSREWERRVYSRLSALPDQAPLLQNARLVAALTVGTEIIRLSSLMHRLDPGLSLQGVLGALVRGNSIAVIECLAAVDRTISAPTMASTGASIRLRARASIRIISDTLIQHTDYFDGSALA